MAERMSAIVVAENCARRAALAHAHDGPVCRMEGDLVTPRFEDDGRRRAQRDGERTTEQKTSASPRNARILSSFSIRMWVGRQGHSSIRSSATQLYPPDGFVEP